MLDFLSALTGISPHRSAINSRASRIDQYWKKNLRDGGQAYTRKSLHSSLYELAQMGKPKAMRALIATSSAITD